MLGRTQIIICGTLVLMIFTACRHRQEHTETDQGINQSISPSETAISGKSPSGSNAQQAQGSEDSGGNLSGSKNCNIADAIRCSETITGNNKSGQQKMLRYEKCVGWEEGGEELVYSFSPEKSSRVSVKLHDVKNGDLDIFVLENSCESTSCIQYGDNSTGFFDVTKGKTYYLVVDANKGVASEFKLALECSEP